MCISEEPQSDKVQASRRSEKTQSWDISDPNFCKTTTATKSQSFTEPGIVGSKGVPDVGEYTHLTKMSTKETNEQQMRMEMGKVI